MDWILALALASSVPPQGAIEGVVSEANGQGLHDARVTLQGPATRRVQITSVEGRYRFEGVPEGEYVLRFERAGFRSVERPQLSVDGKGVLREDASLVVALAESLSVTSERREESVQEIPASVTALTETSLRDSRVTDMTRLAVLVPGLNFALAGQDARPALRGARTENIGAVNDPVVGFYVDGVWKSRFSQGLQAFVDVERVEVQRGPQGTLYGRNAFGGNVNVITTPPAPRFDFGGAALLGAYGSNRFEGFVNVPLHDRAQLRVAGLRERRDGYVSNSGASPDIWDENLDQLRASLRLAPSDRFELVARFSHWDQAGHGQGDFGLLSLGTLRDPETGLISIDGVLDPVSPRRGSLGAAVDTPYEVARDVALTRRGHENVGSLTGVWRTQLLELRSITAFTKFASLRYNDGDLSGNTHAIEYLDESLESFTQELQLASRGDGRLRWLVGALYLRDELGYRFQFDRLTRDVDTDGNPETASAPGSEPSPGVDVQNLESLDTSSGAVFAQASLQITAPLRLTGGVRFTRDAKTYSFLNELTGGYNLGFRGALVKDLEDSWRQVTWRAALDYRRSPDRLLYASVATGFVAGGFAVLAPTLAYGPQHVTAFELGSKNQLGDRTRLNVAAYYADYDDLLANAYGTLTGVSFIYQTNAGSVSSKGVELELATQPIAPLELEAAIALQDSTYGRFILPNPFPRGGDPNLPGNLVDLEGTQVQQQPRFRLSAGVSYRFSLGPIGTLTPRVRTFATSSYGVNDVVLGRDRVSVQDAFTKTDLRLSWASRDHRFQVDAFVQNLEDEAVLMRVVRGGDNILQGSYAPPRTWGVELRCRR